jgi:DNA-binding response OmpR family regulator
MGFEVETAHSSIEGLAKAQAKRFDLCIINGDLHHDSALDMYHQIRANNLLFPIIFTSPDDLPKEIVETIYTGENHFLSLPFEVDVLEALALKLAGSSLMRIAGA